MFQRILIANRGEIACRIIQTCRRLGIETVAVFSDVDRHARHVQIADHAVCIGPAPAIESYLRAERIIDVAQSRHADAIHPGYGFLAENAEFARACEAAGVRFIGPRPKTIEQMGSKSAAKHIMEMAGVPVVPGYHGLQQEPDFLEQRAREIGFPLLIKAVAGGGGKGMRAVHSIDEFHTALVSAARESASAFGDSGVLLERYLQHPRHIEFQIFGDEFGQHVHLFERECSIQRRHQKIIEETPSAFIDEELRAAMADAALKAAQAVDYVSAGTVEFIVSKDKRFYFMEMNTRLQVEHPVTEMTTGQDLVEWQLRIAAGESLPLRQDQINRRGHAIEARIYAENPANEFLPSTGLIERFAHPVPTPTTRVDTGFGSGDRITIHYDPLLAKLSVWGKDREAAVEHLRSALAETMIFGPVTNLALLRQIAVDTAFCEARIDTGYVDRHLEELCTSSVLPRESLIAAAARCLHDRQTEYRIAASNLSPAADPASPWRMGDGWRLNGRSHNRFVFATRDGRQYELQLRGWDDTYQVLRDHKPILQVEIDVLGAQVTLGVDEYKRHFTVLRHEDDLLVSSPHASHELTLINPYARQNTGSQDDAHPGSPMPGRIVALNVAVGDHVERGDSMLVLEGMKMEYTLKARVSGVVEGIRCRVGELVEAEAPLVDIAEHVEDT